MRPQRAHPPGVRPAADQTAASVDLHDELLGDLIEGKLSADELLRRYCTLVYAETGSYEATARRLGIDRRTVRAKVDPELLERWQRGAARG